MEHHRHFVHGHSLNRGAWGLQVHQCGVEILEAACCCDQFGVPNLACLEVVLRHVQLVE